MNEYCYYHIIYNTEHGEAMFEGYYDDYDLFFDAVEKAALEAGLIEEGESVLDCDKSITMGYTLEEVHELIAEDEGE